jgi:ABC-type phosphate/phosphonate transport system substrate-binding protein
MVTRSQQPFPHRTAALAVIFFLPCAALFIAARGAAKPPPASILRIGLSGTLFHQVPESTAKEGLQNLKSLIEKQTGRKNELIVEEKVDEMAVKLVERKLDLAAFIGYELAWAKVKNPKLEPLVVAVNGDTPLRAHVMVQKESPITEFAQLKGKPVAFPADSLPFCKLYLERQCLARGKTPQTFFAKMTNPPTLEDALDDVIDGATQGTVVDSLCIDAYKRRKPGRFTRLKELQKSQVFPAAAIVYFPGTLDEKSLESFRDDLIRSKHDADSTRLLNLWKLTGFELVPRDYEDNLTEIAKAFPEKP